MLDSAGIVYVPGLGIDSRYQSLSPARASTRYPGCRSYPGCRFYPDLVCDYADVLRQRFTYIR